MEMFYWPLFDLLLWGITGSAVQAQTVGDNQIGLLIVLGMLLWLVLQRTQHEMSMSFLTDMWDGNLTNIFISPLTFSEWFLAVSLISSVKMALSFGFASLVAGLLYQLQLFQMGLQIIPIIILLVCFGWALSALNIGALFLFGSKAQTLSWIVIAFLAPFSAIYYSADALPIWAQWLGALLPTRYAFEAARTLFTTGILDQRQLLVGFALGIGYAVIALWLLKHAIYLSLQRGLFKNK